MFTLYLTCDNVGMLNARFVGPDMLRNFGLLDAAVMRPQASVGNACLLPNQRL